MAVPVAFDLDARAQFDGRVGGFRTCALAHVVGHFNILRQAWTDDKAAGPDAKRFERRVDIAPTVAGIARRNPLNDGAPRPRRTARRNIARAEIIAHAIVLARITGPQRPQTCPIGPQAPVECAQCARARAGGLRERTVTGGIHKRVVQSGARAEAAALRHNAVGGDGAEKTVGRGWIAERHNALARQIAILWPGRPLNGGEIAVEGCAEHHVALRPTKTFAWA